MTVAELGINRMSVGVQDFDPRVQQAVNRIQSLEETRVVIEADPTVLQVRPELDPIRTHRGMGFPMRGYGAAERGRKFYVDEEDRAQVRTKPDLQID